MVTVGNDHFIAGLKGFGKKTEQTILEGIEHYSQTAHRFYLSEAKAEAERNKKAAEGDAKSLVEKAIAEATKSFDDKLKANSEEELTAYRLAVEGILALQAGESPRVANTRMRSFLSPQAKRRIEMAGGQSE